MNRLTKKILLGTTLLVASFFVVPIATAQVIVSDAIIEFKNTDRLIQTIAVGNASRDQVLNIKTEITEVIKPATQNEKNIKTKHVSAVPETFTLNPRRQHDVRIVSSKRPKNEEQIFRIVFRPEILKTKNSEPGKLGVISTTAVMMILNPPNPIEKLTWDRTEDRIVFSNDGNTNIVLRRKGLCAKDIPCTIKGRRLWTGDKWYLNLPTELQEEDITLEMRVLGEIKEVVIPYEE